MILNLKDKISLVSGSSRGIGKAIAYGLLKEGAIVYLTGKNEEILNNTYEDFKAQFDGRVYKFCGDLTDTKIIKDLITTITIEQKKLDTAVVNIGSGRFKPGWDIEDDLWLR